MKLIILIHYSKFFNFNIDTISNKWVWFGNQGPGFFWVEGWQAAWVGKVLPGIYRKSKASMLHTYIASFAGSPVSKRKGRIRAWYQPNNESAQIPNACCSITTKRRSIDE